LALGLDGNKALGEVLYYHRGQAPSTLFFIKHKQGDALNDLWNL